jgi:hypothetical protein
MSDLIAEILADPAVTAFATALGAAGIALWIAAAWWAYADATRRTESTLAGYIAAGWVILSTPLMLPLSLAVYVFARPQIAAGDRRVRTLIAELGMTADDQRCPTCGSDVEVAWLRCPSCANWLASPCAACSRWSDVSLELCPWCGDEEREQPAVPQLAPSLVPAAMVPAGMAHPATSATAMADDETAPGDLPQHRRSRPAWRAAAPAVPRSQRADNRRLQQAPDGRRLARARLRA